LTQFKEIGSTPSNSSPKLLVVNVISICRHDVQVIPDVMTEGAVENCKPLLSIFSVGNISENYFVGEGVIERVAH